MLFADVQTLYITLSFFRFSMLWRLWKSGRLPWWFGNRGDREVQVSVRLQTHDA